MIGIEPPNLLQTLWRRRWGSAFCSVLVCLCAGVLAAHGKPPDTSTDSTDQKQRRAARELRVALDVGWVMGISAPDFFADYRLLLGGTVSGFDIPTVVNFNVSSFMITDAPIGLSVGYYKAVVRETYDYDPDMYPRPTGPLQSVTQDMQLTVIPAMVTVDYFPFERQFTTYVGVGVGFAATHMFWEEVLSQSTDPGARQSGVRYDEWQLVPAVSLKAGISLGFDKRLALRTRAGVYVEAGYLYVPISGAYFERTGESLAVDVPRTSNTYEIQAGGAIIRVGFSLLLTGN